MNQQIQTHLLSGNMKYIITESQLNMIQENSLPMWMRRRLNTGELNNYLQKAIEGEDPTYYSDEFEYADNMISFAVNDFLTIDEEFFEEGDVFDEWTDRLTEMMKDEFGEELFEIWRASNPEEEDEEFDDD
jgi:hypothetical protein